MRVRGNQPPATQGGFNFDIFAQPDKKGYVCVKFYENIVKIPPGADDDEHLEIWEYDEYPLIVPKRQGLILDIEYDFDKWLLTAKSHSPQAIAAAENSDLRQAMQILTDVNLAEVVTKEFATFVDFAADFKAKAELR